MRAISSFKELAQYHIDRQSEYYSQQQTDRDSVFEPILMCHWNRLTCGCVGDYSPAKTSEYPNQVSCAECGQS